MERDNGSWYARWRASAFQLTRSRGAWRSYHPFYSQTFHFNSHAHVERDMGRDYRVLICEFQLTRSRGAWHLIKGIALCQIIFQLTRSRGAWRAVVINHNVYNEFQLTRSRGAWLLRLHTPPVPLHFNSHAHVERDEWYKKFIGEAEISTHTLTWSVT